MNRTRLLMVVSLIGLSWGASSSRGCDTPVFRFALERWRPDPFEVVVVHRGELSPEHQALIKRLQGSEDFTPTDANVMVREVDLGEHESQMAARPVSLFQALSTPMAPFTLVAGIQSVRMVGRLTRDDEELLKGVDVSKGPVVVVRPPWSGVALVQFPLAKSEVDHLLDSPVRREIARRLLKGDSAVCLVLLSGDPKKDAGIIERMESLTRRLQKDIKVPVPEDTPFGPPRIAPEGLPPLEIKFSILPYPAKLPAENHLRQTLQWFEPGDHKLPMACWVFGRGRILPPVPLRFGVPEACEAPLVLQAVGAQAAAPAMAPLGSMIQLLVAAETKSMDAVAMDADLEIEAAARYLCGACSCEVKRLNPGADILMSVNWEGLVVGEYVVDEDLPPLQSVSALLSPAPTPTTIPDNQGPETIASAPAPESAPTGEKPAPAPESGKLNRTVWWALGGLGAVVVLGSLLLILRKGGRSA
jgi:hypothetical protein